MNDNNEISIDPKELSIHMKYIRQDINDIKNVMKEMQATSPTKEEVSKIDARLVVVEGHVESLRGDRKYILGAASLIVLLWGAMAMFASLYVDSRIRTVLAEYEVTLK